MKGILTKIFKTSPHDCLNYIRSLAKKPEGEKDHQQLFDRYFESSSSPKLQIGCGYNLAEGWLNTDLTPSAEEVAKLDAGDEFPFSDNSFDFIYSEHILEHLHFEASCNMISECFRVLKPGGAIRIAIPHADFLVDIYQKPNEPLHKEYVKWAMNQFCRDVVRVVQDEEYNEVYIVNNFYRNWSHKMIHNYGSLKQLLEAFSFTEVEQMEVSESGFKEFKRMERHGEIIPEKFNKLETLVVEARKPKV